MLFFKINSILIVLGLQVYTQILNTASPFLSTLVPFLSASLNLTYTNSSYTGFCTLK